MPLPLADAKAMARERLRGKNAKPRDVDRMAKKLVEESYRTQAGGTYKYATASGQGMVHHKGHGEDVEYQTAGNLSNYIDRVLEMGGLNAPSGGTKQTGPATRPATDEEISTVELPERGPDVIEKPTEEPGSIEAPTEKGGLTLSQILAGAGGLALLTALVKYARRKGVEPEQLTPEDVTAAQSTVTSEQPGEIYADEDYQTRPRTGGDGVEETIDEQVQERPEVKPTEPANENADEGSSFNPNQDANNREYQSLAQKAAEFQDPNAAYEYLQSQNVSREALGQIMGDMVDIKTGKGFDFRISRPKLRP